MLDLKFIRENAGLVQEMLQNRQLDMALQPLLDLDAKRRLILQEVEQLKYRRNQASEEISSLKRAKLDASERIQEMKEVAQQIKTLDWELAAVEEKVKEILLLIPNMPHQSVVVGKDEVDNELVKTWGSPPIFDFEPKAHWDIGESAGILDFERAAKMTGARFVLYWGAVQL